MNQYRILQGDVIDTIKEIKDGSVQCSVGSPPYFGLRDYGTATWLGGDPECSHIRLIADAGEARKGRRIAPGRSGIYREECGLCGALRVDDQIGLEETPQEYIDKLVSVYREVKRTLADDGVVFVVLGDTYAGRNMSSLNLKSKDLIGIPWMFAFAMRADGWYLRSEIIWHKTNPMPESIKDRPTRSHEQIFMFTKSRKYYYDHEAIREPAVYPGDDRIARVKSDHKSYPDAKKNGIRKSRSEGHYTYDLNTRNKRDVWTVSTKPYKGAHFATYPPELIEPCILAGSRPGDLVLDPFAGSGTTGAVALKHGRRAVLCELNSDYVPLIEERLRSVNYGDQ